jgi:pimeloyl-ACP methyl ester carboxylesterase
LAEHWVDAFDWRRIEARLDELGSSAWLLGAQRVQFLHRPGKGPRPLALLLLHGWPSSVLEYSRVVDQLSDPAAHGGDAGDAFSVVAAALPGFGFSSPPAHLEDATRWAMAGVLGRLMIEGLGYDRFGVHGTDTGATVAEWLAHDRPDAVAGLHIAPLIARDVFSSHPTDDSEMREYLRQVRTWRSAEGGYAAIQGSKPATLATSLADSPVGLAAWMVEKFRTWSDCDGDIERRFSKDDLLAQVSLYWLSGSIGSSFLPYFVDRRIGQRPFGRVEAPTAIMVAPRDITIHPPRNFVAGAFNLQRWTRLQSGGHFPAFEEPEAFVADLREFFRPLR